MIPGTDKSATCGQTINLRLPYGLLFSIGLKVQEGQIAMIKSGATDTIPCFMGTTIQHHRRIIIYMQAFFFASGVAIGVYT